MPAYFNFGAPTAFAHYARPVPAQSPWGTGAVNGTTNATTGEVVFASISAGNWRIHRTTNLATKLETDEDVGGISLDAATAAAQATALGDLDIDGYDLTEAMRIMAAILAGEVSGAGTTTERFEAIDGSKERVAAVTDRFGNRTSITRDAT
jgi:hypothetical protein